MLRRRLHKYERFKGFGTLPDKQGDYAYLLHIVRSLKPTSAGPTSCCTSTALRWVCWS